MRSLRTSWWLLTLALGACAEEEAGPSSDLRADLAALHAVVDRDPATEPLAMVDRRIDEDRPVHAAEVLQSTGIPAAERQVALVEAQPMRTDEGRAFQRRLVTAYRHRVDALVAWREILQGGVAVDPLRQLDGVRGVRRAEEELLAVVRAMDELLPRRPPRPGGEPGEGTGGQDDGAGARGDGTPPAGGAGTPPSR